ncbi:MAG: hypothetical protein H6579_04965 [Chitinophagales bacterium]|nr:hypothetical protein [Chitinophagales bacterium]
MKLKIIYGILFLFIAAVIGIQCKFYKEKRSIDKLGELIQLMDNKEVFLTEHYEEILSKETEQNRALLLQFPHTEHLNNQDLIQFILRNIMEDFSVHYYKTEKTENYTKIAMLIDGSKKDYVLSFSLDKASLVDDIDGLFEFLKDIKEYRDFSVGKNCL